MDDLYDIAVIGGGINGAGLARDAAGRGYKVVLFEAGDLAGATSSASTKLIHGGLRYLEQFEFRLVREALKERAVLRRIAPHNVRPLRFVLPHHAGLRPRWMLRAGLFLYDVLGARALGAARELDLSRDKAGAPLKPGYRFAFSYADCRTDDARLVVLNARDAADRGAAIRVRTAVAGAQRQDAKEQGAHWALTIAGEAPVRARALINAAGPWVSDVLAAAGVEARARVRLVQGSHIVTPRLFDQDEAYLFQQRDGRIVFAIPFEESFTLIGTTDRDWRGDARAAAASEEEIAYLCAAANEYFQRQIAPGDVVWTYSGVRALYDDGESAAQKVTRDYVLALDAAGPAMLSIFGGKITTYRRLAEAALAKLAPHLPPVARGAWTASQPLPGGDFPSDGLDALAERVRAARPALSSDHALRLARAYGTRALTVSNGDLGEIFCADLSAREVDYLMAEEWARTAEDVLWRRSKLGLKASAAQRARLEAYMRERLAAA
ncbi:MAG: glycerol-3-phosphate dehydrogenase [Hyphomonadaceae bacterium]